MSTFLIVVAVLYLIGAIVTFGVMVGLATMFSIIAGQKDAWFFPKTIAFSLAWPVVWILAVYDR